MHICDWLHFAARSSPRGARWVEDFRRHRPVLELGTEALKTMREGQLANAGSMLGDFVSQVETLQTQSLCERAVMERYRRGIQGYYFYCTRDFEGAANAMDLAHAAVARALTACDESLLLLAVHCQEFRLHQARIARNQRRWSAMNADITHARAMMSDSMPLCHKEDGEAVLWSSFDDFFTRMAPLSTEEAEVARTLLDPVERTRLFDQFAREILAPKARSNV